MDQDKLDQNEERIWLYMFHSLGLSFGEALGILSKIESKIKIKLLNMEVIKKK